jgi:hypothetical protein
MDIINTVRDTMDCIRIHKLITETLDKTILKMIHMQIHTPIHTQIHTLIHTPHPPTPTVIQPNHRFPLNKISEKIK